MPTKKEREAMLKAIGKVNNKWELIAFIWAFRQKELWKTIAGIEFFIVMFFIIKYTELIESIYMWIVGLLK